MKKIAILLILCSCSYSYQSKPIYAKTFNVGNSYTSHVVWSVDSLGCVTGLSTH